MYGYCEIYARNLIKPELSPCVKIIAKYTNYGLPGCELWAWLGVHHLPRGGVEAARWLHLGHHLLLHAGGEIFSSFQPNFHIIWTFLLNFQNIGSLITLSEHICEIFLLFQHFYDDSPLSEHFYIISPFSEHFYDSYFYYIWTFLQ